MGSFLQTVLFGYGGLRLHLEQLDFLSPRLPPMTSRVAFRSLTYLGTEFDLELSPDLVNITVLGINSSHQLQLSLADGSSYLMETGS